MKASPGNLVVIESNHLGSSPRRGVIVEVHGADGEPPYLVRWNDSHGETLFFPGPDTHIVPAEQPH